MNFLFLIKQILNNFPLVCAIVSLLFCQFFKLVFESIKQRKIKFFIFFSPGGVISSHIATTTSLTLALGIKEGFGSGIFALSLVFLGIVIFDAVVVREEAARHGEILNKILKEFLVKKKLDGEVFREVLGHSPFEAFWGILVGIIVPLFMRKFFF